MKNKPYLITSLLIIILAIIVILKYYYLSENNKLPEKTINNTVNWNTFKDTQYWFELKYPNDFFDIWHEPKTLSWTCNVSDFPNSCPNINNIVTDLTYYNNWNNTWKILTINNTPYCLYQVSEAATGHIYNYYYYTTVKQNKCFIVSLETSSTNCDFYLPLEENNIEQKQNYEKCINKNKNQPEILKDIVNSFRFVEK